MATASSILTSVDIVRELIQKMAIPNEVNDVLESSCDHLQVSASRLNWIRQRLLQQVPGNRRQLLDSLAAKSLRGLRMRRQHHVSGKSKSRPCRHPRIFLPRGH